MRAVAYDGAPQREDVVQVVGRVLRHAQRAVLGEEEVHLDRAFGAGCHLELDADPVDDLLLPGVGDLVGRGDQAEGAERRGRAEAGADLTGRALRELAAVHVQRAPAHGGPGVDVLGDGRVHEAVPGVDRDLGLVDAVDPAEVIGVRVRVDDRLHGLVAPVLPVERKGRGRGLARQQRVDHDDPVGALDERHVREVEPPHLVDAVRDREEPLHRGQLALPPEARVRGLGAVAVEERVRVVVPHDVTGGAVHDARFHRSDQAPLRLVEVRPVREICHETLLSPSSRPASAQGSSKTVWVEVRDRSRPDGRVISREQPHR